MLSDNWSLPLPGHVHGDELAADQLVREGCADGVPRATPTLPAAVDAAFDLRPGSQEAVEANVLITIRSIQQVTCCLNVFCPMETYFN